MPTTATLVSDVEMSRSFLAPLTQLAAFGRTPTFGGRSPSPSNTAGSRRAPTGDASSCPHTRSAKVTWLVARHRARCPRSTTNARRTAHSVNGLPRIHQPPANGSSPKALTQRTVRSVNPFCLFCHRSLRTGQAPTDPALEREGRPRETCVATVRTPTSTPARHKGPAPVGRGRAFDRGGVSSA